MIDVQTQEMRATERVLPLVGAVIGPIHRTASARQVVRYAVLARELAEIHYDTRAVAGLGARLPIVNGGLKSAWFAQLLESHVGSRPMIRSIELRFRGADEIETEYRVEGKVTEVSEVGDRASVTVELRGVGRGDAPTVTGHAVVEVDR